MSRIITFTGRLVDPLTLRPEDVDIRDIAHALALKCRWGGMTKAFYSVAEHSVRLSEPFWIPSHLEKAALMHDGAEAYLGDIVGPLKSLIDVAGKPFSVVECQIQEVIFAKYDIPLSHLEEIKVAEHANCPTILHPRIPVDKIEPWSWQLAEYRFLQEVASWKL